MAINNFKFSLCAYESVIALLSKDGIHAELIRGLILRLWKLFCGGNTPKN